MTIKDRTKNIETLTNELLRDMEAKLKKKAEENGEPIYEGLRDAKENFKDMMSWLEDISEELEQS